MYLFFPFLTFFYVTSVSYANLSIIISLMVNINLVLIVLQTSCLGLYYVYYVIESS